MAPPHPQSSRLQRLLQQTVGPSPWFWETFPELHGPAGQVFTWQHHGSEGQLAYLVTLHLAFAARQAAPGAQLLLPAFRRRTTSARDLVPRRPQPAIRTFRPGSAQVVRLRRNRWLVQTIARAYFFRDAAARGVFRQRHAEGRHSSHRGAGRVSGRRRAAGSDAIRSQDERRCRSRNLSWSILTPVLVDVVAAALVHSQSV